MPFCHFPEIYYITASDEATLSHMSINSTTLYSLNSKGLQVHHQSKMKKTLSVVVVVVVLSFIYIQESYTFPFIGVRPLLNSFELLVSC